MANYIARRIFLMLPTLLGILFVSFVVVQFAPGGPVERVLAQLSGADTGGTNGSPNTSSATLPRNGSSSLSSSGDGKPVATMSEFWNGEMVRA